MRQLRRPTIPDPSSPGIFTPVPIRLRLYVTPYSYAQRWNMLPLLGPLIYTAQNCNKLEQVQPRAARFACHRYERTASVTDMLNDLKWETLETRRNNQRLRSIVCNTTWCLFLQLTILPQFSRHEAEDQVTTRCIKCRMPGQTSTNTLSSQ